MDDLQEPVSDGCGLYSKPGERLQRYEQRLESLLDAFWLSALSGDHKSGELCRRLLQQQAEVFRLGEQNEPAEDADDELAKLRARRSG